MIENGWTLFGQLSAVYLLYCVISKIVSRYWKVSNVGMYMDDNNESWAIITGASDGIGKSFAIQLAEMGYSVVLISRSREALEKVQDLIQSKYSVQTIVYPFDFGKYDAANFESLKVAIKAINPCILVNNVGICTEIPTSFLETESAFIRKMVQVNIGAALEMTGIVLPIFDHKNKGLIVNVGSGLGDYSSGLLATYGATKAFLKNWSKALDIETKSGIKVHYLNTLWVATKLSRIRPSIWFPSPEKYVKSVLSILGSGSTCITPYFWHFIIDWMINLIPESFTQSQMYEMSEQLRSRAIAKAKRHE